MNQNSIFFFIEIGQTNTESRNLKIKKKLKRITLPIYLQFMTQLH
jgi:hypothetical protein